jgi:hypothetical protein
MSQGILPAFGSFSTPGAAPIAGTPIVQGIPPFPGPAGTAPFIYNAVGLSGLPNWMSGPSNAITHVASLNVKAGSTAHAIIIARPKNWTTVASAAAAGQAVINITADPGIYSTNYRYPLPGVVASSAGLYAYPGRVPDSGISAGDYCAYQLTDGTWVFDTVASVSTLAITMTNNVPTGGVAAGAPFFLFKVPGTNLDPATGQLDPSFTTVVSANNVFTDYLVGICQSLHKGDPLLIVDGNATAADVLNYASGFYSPL